MYIILLCLFLALTSAIVANVYVRSRKQPKNPAPPEKPEAPPIRKTWVDVQVENLVNEVLQSIQQQPGEWTTWGVYEKGFGGKITNFEYSDKSMGVIISPSGLLKYHSFMQKKIEEKEEKHACWFEVPLTDFDINRIEEAFVWLATTKSLDFLKAKKQPKWDPTLPKEDPTDADEKLPEDDAPDKVET